MARRPGFWQPYDWLAVLFFGASVVAAVVTGLWGLVGIGAGVGNVSAYLMRRRARPDHDRRLARPRHH